MKLLVVDDERRIAESIKQGLEQEGYAVDVAFDGEDGYNAAWADEYDAIILDVMMPVMNGFEVVQKLRSTGNHTPVLMLTAKDQTQDIVVGLDHGADDYLPKPFSFDVLAARVRALLRRPQEALGTVLRVADIELDTRQADRDASWPAYCALGQRICHLRAPPAQQESDPQQK